MLIDVYDKVIVPASPLLNETLTQYNLKIQDMATKLDTQYHRTAKHIANLQEEEANRDS